MVKDVYEASWDILETLLKEGSINANQIFNKTSSIGSKSTLQKALGILQEEQLISIDSKKFYTINRFKFDKESQVLQVYNDYKNLADDFRELFDQLGERLKNHRPILNPTNSDMDLVRDLLMKEPYFNLLNGMIRLFQLGASMEFFINADVFPKIIEKRAISLRRKNEKLFRKYFELLRKHEPVLWGEIVKLVQVRLANVISPA